MRIGLLAEGGYPYASHEGGLWCDRLVRGLAQHVVDVYALSRSARQEDGGWVSLPPQVARVRTAALWEPAVDGRRPGRHARRRFAAHIGQLAQAVCGTREDAVGSFAEALYGLAELARESGGLAPALRSETALRALESACRAPGARRGLHGVTVTELLAVTDRLERALRPLSLDWYGEEDGLGAVDLCHATSAGRPALAGLMAKRFFGVPLLVTEYGVQLRAHYLAGADARLSAPVRTLLASFHRLHAAEVYRQAAVITPGTTHARRWQERCGADRAKLRTVYAGIDAEPFAAVGEAADTLDPGVARTLVWVGRVEPAKDLITLLHAFARVREQEPDARLRVITEPGRGRNSAAYLAHCEALAARLIPSGAAGPSGPSGPSDAPVVFERRSGGPAQAYAAGGVSVLSSAAEGFPAGLVEAMLCGRATVSTDVGAVVEVIGGTGLVVPPRNAPALADACLALLRDPDRRARLGAAARARALELFTTEQNVAAFRGIYLELLSHTPARRTTEAVNAAGGPVPFALPAEDFLQGTWTGRPGAPGWAGRPVGAHAGGGRG
ncbi:DUF3492 domain-containing protein [Streptomyces sp. NPDC045431]|uniref:DUF3492 domain-containing protein n=1 Tax=Streptomyces sp. NPDC045431 TaxID=3155613 RepID=UPI0033CB0FBA